MSERLFPIFGGPAIPWRLIEPHEKQAIINHDQTLERLAQRGGLSCGEAIVILEDVNLRTTAIDEPAARARLIKIIEADSLRDFFAWKAKAEKAEESIVELQIKWESTEMARIRLMGDVMDLKAERDTLKACCEKLVGYAEPLADLIGDVDSLIKQDEDGWYCKQCSARLDEGGTHEPTCLVSRVIDLSPLAVGLDELKKPCPKPQ